MQSPRFSKAGLIGISGSVFTLMFSSLTFGAAQLEEVIVTAEKREQNLEDVPISLAVMSEKDLETFGISDINDIKNLVPNMQIAPFAGGNADVKLFIRGVGLTDVQITQDSAVALYKDGIYIGRSSGLSAEIGELERVEVLRGPQGTLSGRNATGGAVNLVLKKPNLEDMEIVQKLSYGNESYFLTSTSVNLPIADGRAAVKAAYLKSQKDGWLKNTGEGDDFWDEDRQGANLDLRWQISDNLLLDYSYDFTNTKDVSFTYQAGALASAPVVPSAELIPVSENRLGRLSQALPPTNNDIDIQGHHLILTWDIGDLTLKSLTGYRELEQENHMDFSAGYPLFTVFATSPAFTEQDQFSQEFQLLGDALDGQLEYITGVYYFEESADIVGSSNVFGTPNSSGSESSADNESMAAFAQFTYRPASMDSKLGITAGARYTKDKREARLVNIAGGVPTSDRTGDNDWSKFTPSISVQYDLDDSNIYAKIATAYKSGGFNIRATDIDDFAAGFDEENLTSYEVGLKGNYFDRRLRVNAAAFYSLYDDIQLNVTIPGNTDPSQTGVFNAGEATIKGFELDVTALVTSELQLRFNYGYLDPEYDKINDPFLGDVTTTFQFSNAPEHSYLLALDYVFNPFSTGEVALNVNYAWQDEVVYNRRVADEDFALGDSYGALGARLSWGDIELGSSGLSLQVSVWGKNLTDEEYVIDAVSTFQTLHASRLIAFAEPRSYGIDAIFRY